MLLNIYSIFAEEKDIRNMKRTTLLLIMLAVASVCITAQNWEVNMLHDINGWDTCLRIDGRMVVGDILPTAVGEIAAEAHHLGCCPHLI